MPAFVLTEPADLFGEGVTAVKAEDPLAELPIITDALGITFKVHVRRLAIIEFEEFTTELTKARELPEGKLREDAIAECDRHFLQITVPKWEGLTLSNFYRICNDGRKYEGAPGTTIGDMLADPTKTMGYRIELLRHIYRFAHGPDFREKIQSTIRATVDRTAEIRADRKNESGASAA